ncbi:protein of unknown function [Candidatus Nitrospira inopinata]|uniref:Uncharacterized protein n=1 Tax=Candidatus Nitrospira inopinata TaxID=1715989 RepID=A0A0S4KU21_9BACT|nr:protein of unknown function [Candidatus Nitrospira inopinata]
MPTMGMTEEIIKRYLADKGGVCPVFAGA